MAGLAAVAFSAGGFEASFAAFVTAAATMLVLLFALAFVIGTSQLELVDRLRASTGMVKRTGGLILVAIGVWFIALGVFAGFFADIFPV